MEKILVKNFFQLFLNNCKDLHDQYANILRFHLISIFFLKTSLVFPENLWTEKYIPRTWNQ